MPFSFYYEGLTVTCQYFFIHGGDFMVTFQDRLKELRKKSKHTQKEMGLLIHVNERNYRRYEAGEIEPNKTVILTLADYFNVSTDYLLGRSNDPTIH